MKTPKQEPIKERKPIPPPSQRHQDKKKAQDKKAARRWKEDE